MGDLKKILMSSPNNVDMCKWFLSASTTLLLLLLLSGVVEVMQQLQHSSSVQKNFLLDTADDFDEGDMINEVDLTSDWSSPVQYSDEK